MLSLLCLALGNFALGTGAFVIAGVLPQIGGDLGVDAAQAALLMTVFALVYALPLPCQRSISAFDSS